MNPNRLLLGGVVAAVIGFVTDGLLHEQLLHAEWEALYTALAAPVPQEHGGSALLYFAVFELGRGLLAILLYAALRGSRGPGARTATLAGLLTWVAVSVSFPVQFVPLGFYSHALWWKVAAFQLPTTLLAAIAGAALYRPRGVEAGAGTR